MHYAIPRWFGTDPDQTVNPTKEIPMDDVKFLKSTEHRQSTLTVNGIEAAAAVISKHNQNRYVVLHLDPDDSTIFVPAGVAEKIKVYGDVEVVRAPPGSSYTVDMLERGPTDPRYSSHNRATKVHLEVNSGESACTRHGAMKSKDPREVTCGRCMVSAPYKRAARSHEMEMVEGSPYLVLWVKPDRMSEPCGFCGKSHPVAGAWGEGDLKDITCLNPVAAVLSPEGTLITYGREVYLRFR
jgi:hypothetical protein